MINDATIRVGDPPSSYPAPEVVVEPNRRYELTVPDGPRRRLDVTGVDAPAGVAYAFCADTGELVTLKDVPGLVAEGRLLPIDTGPDSDLDPD